MAVRFLSLEPLCALRVPSIERGVRRFMDKGLFQYSLPFVVSLGPIRVNQQVVVAASKGLHASMDPYGLNVTP